MIDATFGGAGGGVGFGVGLGVGRGASEPIGFPAPSLTCAT